MRKKVKKVVDTVKTMWYDKQVAASGNETKNKKIKKVIDKAKVMW